MTAKSFSWVCFTEVYTVLETMYNTARMWKQTSSDRELASFDIEAPGMLIISNESIKMFTR